jgi:hypothetical protein
MPLFGMQSNAKETTTWQILMELMARELNLRQ